MFWLKEPKKHFPKQEADIDEYGVCCGRIQNKLGLSQSTVSHYLKLLDRCGLVISTRSAQWTFYKRNAKFIDQFLHDIQTYL